MGEDSWAAEMMLITLVMGASMAIECKRARLCRRITPVPATRNIIQTISFLNAFIHWQWATVAAERADVVRGLPVGLDRAARRQRIEIRMRHISRQGFVDQQRRWLLQQDHVIWWPRFVRPVIQVLKFFLNLTKGTQKRNYWCKDSRTLKVTFNEQPSNWNGKLQGIRYCRLLQRKFQFLSLQSVANISRLNMSSRASPKLSSFLKRILTNCHPQIEATAQEKKNDEKQWKKWNQIMACLWEKRGLRGPSNLQKYHIHIGKH